MLFWNLRLLRALRVRGPFYGTSGHDRHVREFVRELHNQGVSVQLQDIPEWHSARLPEDARDPWFDSLRNDCGAGLTLHFCMPHQVKPDRAKVNVNYTMFEASRVPAAWVRANLRHELVIVPTESSRSAWLAGGIPEHLLRLCPLGIDPRRYPAKDAPAEIAMPNGINAGTYRTRFLNISEWGPRKNVEGLLRVWVKATTAKDDAVLIVKLSRNGPLRDLFRFVIGSVEQQVGRSMGDAAPVHFLEHTFSDDEMPRLYTAATHYLSMSFGEGWDQPMMEAGASGLKLIAPDHSAYRAYLDGSIAILIPSRTVPAKCWADPATARLFDGAEWWEPDEDYAASCIRAEIDRRGEAKRPASERILGNFTWKQATARLIAILSEAQDAKAKRSFFLRLR